MYEQLKLNNQLCFPLYALSKEITRRYTPFLDALDLTYPQYLVMLVLWEHGEQRVNDIGAKLLLDSGTLTPLLKRLESKGLILRNRSTADERSVVITLTEQGRELENIAAQIPEKVGNCLNLNFEEATVLRKLTHQLLQQLSH